MLNSVSHIRPTTYTGVNTPMNGISVEQALDKVPVTSKINDKQQQSMGSLAVLGGGAMAGPILGKGLEALSGPNGPLVKFAKIISDKTPGFDRQLAKLSVGQKISNFFKPITSKIFKPNNWDTFIKPLENKGLVGSTKASMQAAKDSIKMAYQNTFNTSVQKAVEKATYSAAKEAAKKGLAGEAAEKFIQKALLTAEKAAQQEARQVAVTAAKASAKKALPKIKTAQKTLQTLDKFKGMNKLGKLFGKTGIWLKKNLTGGVGIMNGLFAAMTINSVIQAKPGEKFSTFMEDFFGTWIGSLGGFRLFESGMARLARIDVAAKGTLPTISKIINKIPFKGFVVPMIGAIALSSLLQKMSHKLFGKPTKEEPKVIDSVDDLNSWLSQTGWTKQDFENIRAAQMNKQNPDSQPAPQTSSFIPSSEIPQSIYQKEEVNFAELDKKVETTLNDMTETLSQVGVKI